MPVTAHNKTARFANYRLFLRHQMEREVKKKKKGKKP